MEAKRRVLRVERLTPPVPPPRDDGWMVNNFDLVRLFAATQVMWGHATYLLFVRQPHALEKLTNLFPGVPIFFVLSGFLVCGSWERLQSLRRYAIARATRIYPALWGSFAFTMAAIIWAGALGWSLVGSFRFPGWIGIELAGGSTTPAEVQAFGTGTPNASLWTIGVELGFYVCLPIIYVIAVRGRTRAMSNLLLLGFALLSVGARLWLVPRNLVPHAGIHYWLYLSPLPHLWMFVAGMAAYLNRDLLLKVVAGRGVWFLAAYVAVAWTVLYPAFGESTRFAQAAYFPTMLLLGLTAIAVAYTGRTAAEKVLRGTDISYGVYLYHFVVLNIVWELDAGPHGYIHVFALMAATVVLAYASWKLIEHPARRLRRWLDRVTADSAPVHWAIVERVRPLWRPVEVQP